jgi:hypothetical protein
MAALWAEISEPDVVADRRESARRTLRLVARAAHAQKSNQVLILDLSTTGLMIETTCELVIDDQVEVELPNAGPIIARVVWQRENYFGCEFITRAPVAAVSAALLRAAPRTRDLSGAVATRTWQIDRREDLPPKLEPANQGLTMFLLVLLLVAVTIFLLALLTLPFSADQFSG